MQEINFIKSGPSLTEEELAAFEKSYGFRLPKDYRKFLMQTNGGKPSKSKFVMPGRKMENEVISFFSLLDSDLEGLKYEVEGVREEAGYETLIPFAFELSRSWIAVTTQEHSHQGVFLISYPEDRAEDEDPQLIYLAQNFSEFCNNLD